MVARSPRRMPRVQSPARRTRALSGMRRGREV